MAHKAGFVNIIGNPNVGKSTLMNSLVGEKMSIVTAKAQTTRHRIMGIVNKEDCQIVFSDTPGALAALTHLLGELDSNIVDIQHQRAFGGSSVRATLVELVLQMRGEEQKGSVAQVLEQQGYDVREVL